MSVNPMHRRLTVRMRRRDVTYAILLQHLDTFIVFKRYLAPCKLIPRFLGASSIPGEARENAGVEHQSDTVCNVAHHEQRHGGLPLGRKRDTQEAELRTPADHCKGQRDPGRLFMTRYGVGTLTCSNYKHPFIPVVIVGQ